MSHHERATLRVGDVFSKIDADQTATDVEVEAMTMAPIPTPEAWAVAGAAVRMLHDAPLPPWPGRSLNEIATSLDSEFRWLQANDVSHLASLTLGHPEHLGDVITGYGVDVIRARWSWRSLTAIRWLVEHGFDPSSLGCEVDVLRSQL